MVCRAWNSVRIETIVKCFCVFELIRDVQPETSYENETHLGIRDTFHLQNSYHSADDITTCEE